jgi:hypothetical protein
MAGQPINHEAHNLKIDGRLRGERGSLLRDAGHNGDVIAELARTGSVRAVRVA